MKLHHNLLSLALACGLLTACSGDAAQLKVTSEEECIPVNYTLLVYYFPCTEADFGKALGIFKAENRHMQITAMTSNGTGGNGYNHSYFVSAEAK